MTDRSVREQVKAFYNDKSLTEDQWRLLQQRMSPSAQKRAGRIWQIATIAGVAAVVVVFAVFVFSRTYPHADLLTAIVNEVNMNHNKRLEVEFPVGQVASLRQEMDRLDFHLRWPQRLGAINEAFTLIGARYCSIQGRIAAQMKLKRRDDGGVYTLYVSGEPDGLARDLQTADVYIRNRDGNVISLWEEHGLLYALAGASPPGG